MNKSESIANLAAALAKAQAALKNPHFDSTNPHFKSKFASLAAVRESVIPVLSAHGISLSQWPTATENGFAGCTTHLAHETGEWMEQTFLIPVDKGNAHGYASAVTYAKRISMQSVAAVVGDEDDDGNAAVESKKPSPITASASMADEYDRMDEAGKRWIDGIADAVRDWVGKGDMEAAIAEIDAAIPYTPRHDSNDSGHKLALQSRLDSKTLTALKKARAEQLKKAA